MVMNLRELLGLLVVGVLAITAISGCTCGTPTTTAPSGETEPSAEGTYLEMTSQELKEIIYDERLIREQREEIWLNQYKGKRVMWLGVLDDAPAPGEVEFESGEDVRVNIEGRDLQDLAYENEWFGDVLWFTGTLQDYDWFSDFLLVQGTMGPLVLERVWSRDCDLEGYWAIERLEDMGVAGVDNGHFFYCQPHLKSDPHYEDGDFYDGWVEITINVVDKTNGYFVSDKSIDLGGFRMEELSAMVQQRAEQEILAMAGDDFAFLSEQLPMELNLGGLTLKIGEDFTFSETETGKLWCIRATGALKVLIVDGAIYTYSPSVGAFGNCASLWFNAYQLHIP
jgi:hypothetical protein